MSTLPTPQARRLRPPSWKDARLLLGLLLVLSSVVAGALAVRALDDRRGVWAAKGEMVPGDVVTEEDLVRVDVQLADEGAGYLRTSERLPEGAVLDRPVRPGELVPRSALVDPGSVAVRRVAVHVDPIYLTGLARGSRVSVFAAAPPEADQTPGSGTLDYRLMLERVTVESLPERGGTVLGGPASSAVVLLVPVAEVERVLTADTERTPLKLVAEGDLAGTGG